MLRDTGQREKGTGEWVKEDLREMRWKHGFEEVCEVESVGERCSSRGTNTRRYRAICEKHRSCGELQVHSGRAKCEQRGGVGEEAAEVIPTCLTPVRLQRRWSFQPNHEHALPRTVLSLNA